MPFATRSGLGLADEAPLFTPAFTPSRYAGLFASLTAATSKADAPGAAASAPRAAAPAVEPRTHTPFTTEYCHLIKRECPTLAGVGARSKRLLGIKNVDVYALGLYVDPAAVKKVAAGKKAVDDALLAAVVGDAVPKTLRVVVTTGLMTRARFLASVRETLAPALTKAGDPTAMDSFEALFASTEFSKGTDLAFSNVPGGGMAVQAGGRELGRLASKAFAPAFFDLYLGKEPVSVEGKKSMVAGLAGLVAE